MGTDLGVSRGYKVVADSNLLGLVRHSPPHTFTLTVVYMLGKLGSLLRELWQELRTLED
jgi:hypothetical protein